MSEPITVAPFVTIRIGANSYRISLNNIVVPEEYREQVPWFKFHLLWASKRRRTNEGSLITLTDDVLCIEQPIRITNEERENILQTLLQLARRNAAGDFEGFTGEVCTININPGKPEILGDCLACDAGKLVKFPDTGSKKLFCNDADCRTIHETNKEGKIRATKRRVPLKTQKRILSPQY